MFLRASGITALIAGALALMAAPAFAAKGGAGSGTTSSSSSISIASIDGTRMAATTTSPTTKLGDSLAFATTVQPLAGWQYPMVAVSCYQDVNGDGVVDTSLSGPDVVFVQLDKPSTAFMLGGYSSPWLSTGGDATCRADLDSYGFKSGVEYTQVLAHTPNWHSLG
jgi:hypothetical protein